MNSQFGLKSIVRSLSRKTYRTKLIAIERFRALSRAGQQEEMGFVNQTKRK